MNDEKSDVQVDDWDVYRSLSLSPGGFGDKRIDIWSVHYESYIRPLQLPIGEQSCMLKHSLYQKSRMIANRLLTPMRDK